MEWITPKTDWLPTDRYDYRTFNRILNNLYYLQDLANKLFKRTDYVDMPDEVDVTTLPYADLFNEIEINFIRINVGTFRYQIGEQKTYSANQPPFNYEELNRIESTILRIKNELDTNIAIMPRYSFRLGNMKGVKL